MNESAELRKISFMINVTLACIIIVLVVAAVSVAVGIATIVLERKERVQCLEYPDPVCEECGGVMNGHGCRCE